MSTQNYANHRKYVIGYHFITFTIAFLLLIISIYNFYLAVNGTGDMRYGVMFLLISFIIISMFFYSRIFALKAQDRAIRAEENFRHYLLTGKIFDSKITLPQILALRFASDEEFTELTKKAASENLSSDEIKKLIKNWRADNYRA